MKENPLHGRQQSQVYKSDHFTEERTGREVGEIKDREKVCFAEQRQMDFSEYGLL